jgi:hypothetical protein
LLAGTPEANPKAKSAAANAIVLIGRGICAAMVLSLTIQR